MISYGNTKALLDHSDGKLNLNGQLKPYQENIHRSGWNYAMEALKPLNNHMGIIMDNYIDKTFGWDGKCMIPYTKDWIGFMHFPHELPSWHPEYQRCQKICDDPLFIESLKYCKGIFTLSNYHKKFLQTKLNVPISNLFHPTETPDITWNINKFKANKTKKVVQLGYFLRRMHSIYQLPTLKYKKILLRPNNDAIDGFMKLEKENELKHSDINYSSAEVVSFLPNDHYDDLLSQNIAFVHLYDASANNAIIECIVRNTPVLVNPIESVVEYLGTEYPFYFETLEEAAEKLENDDLIYKTYLYLCNHPTKLKLTQEYFFNNLKESNIYKNIQIPYNKTDYMNKEILSLELFVKYHDDQLGRECSDLHKWREDQKELITKNKLDKIKKNIIIKKQETIMKCRDHHSAKKSVWIKKQEHMLETKDQHIIKQSAWIKKQEVMLKQRDEKLLKFKKAMDEVRQYQIHKHPIKKIRAMHKLMALYSPIK